MLLLLLALMMVGVGVGVGGDEVKVISLWMMLVGTALPPLPLGVWVIRDAECVTRGMGEKNLVADEPVGWGGGGACVRMVGWFIRGG